MDDMTEEQTNTHNMVILNKLGEIATSLAVNTSETGNIKNKVEEIKVDLKELKQKVEFQNGRVTKTEEWSKEAQKIIENTNKLASETAISYKVDKTRLWASIAVLTFLGGTIITLSIMAINSKIKDGIDSALSQYDIEIKK